MKNRQININITNFKYQNKVKVIKIWFHVENVEESLILIEQANIKEFVNNKKSQYKKYNKKKLML